MIPLEDLGRKICIIGPSSGRKSTLVKALGEKLQVKVCHLDQLAHIPGTNWQLRNKELFRKDHAEFLKENREWIIEGNYSFLMKERFTDATVVIWLDFNVPGSILRYLLRTLKSSASHPGNLPGAEQQFSWQLIKYIVFKAPRNREKLRQADL
ncbi:adenylate kinase [Chryseobacterium sp. SN22]|uniref:adenylate kinase n=1 Tax=Chryseobacterium sp. SN22 TaxID=2606431 RepID=UPI001E4E3AAF|nr:adenylate kinase [Chryseobacterium sp. SN22]